MVRKPPTHPEPDFDALVRQHAPELLRAIYRGLLDREADDGGLLHHSTALREQGDLAGLLRNFAHSEELLKLATARTERHLESTLASLPPPAKKIAIFANCQGNALARAMQALTGTQPPSVHFVSNEDLARPERGAGAVREALAQHDVVLMQPRYAAVMRPAVPELDAKLKLVPAISFSAFHPDLCHVRLTGTLVGVQGPLDAYHSSLVYYAWRRGLSESEAAGLFCEAVYRTLRFYDYWGSAEQALLAEGESAGLPLDGALRDWRLHGCFMHAPAHPKISVLVDLARRVLATLDIPTLPFDPTGLLWDDLAESPVWPVYPEIAAQLGLEGHTLFKGRNQGQVARGAAPSYDLAAFIHHSYAAYARYSARHELTCTREFTPRYAEVFGRPPKSRGASRAAAKPTPRKTPREHPYATLPDRQFWKQAVQQTPAAAMDPVDAAAFTLTRSTRVASAGSCFAQHLVRRLKQHGFHVMQTEAAPVAMDADTARQHHYGVYTARYGNLYTARQLLQLFERAYGEFTPAELAWSRADGRLADPFRPDIEPEGFADAAALHAARATHLAAVREMFETLEVFVFTLGLTEAWRSTVDGAVFPLAPGIVAGTVDPARHAWVNFTAEEVTADLERFVARLAEKNPRAKVLLTVSPVPLAATHDARHVVSATTYSKAVLRVAAETIVRRHAHCAYFPAYEIVAGHYHHGAYFAPDRRSVNAAGVDHVMRLFLAHYAPTAGALAADAELLEDAADHYRLVCEEERLSEARS